MTSRAALALVLALGCAHVDAGRYGVDNIAFDGVDAVDEYALRACLATRERSRLRLTLGPTTEPECGEAPFTARRLSLGLWRWPWSDWPLFDRSVFERDLQRIERWYRARGYYDVRVGEPEVSPPRAARNDRLPSAEEAGGEGDAEASSPCQRRDGEGCRVRLRIPIEEGEPVRVRRRDLSVDTPRRRAARGEPGGRRDPVADDASGARERIRQALRDAWTFSRGDIFDEAAYDATKRAMLRRLHDATYACGEVRGDVLIDRERRRADVDLRVVPGPASFVARVDVLGAEGEYPDIVRAVADLERGDPFRESDLAGAQRAIFALGAFASVDVVGIPRRQTLRGDADAAPQTVDEAALAPRLESLDSLEARIDGDDEAQGRCTGEVDVVIRVRRGRRVRYGLGGGLQVGSTAVGTAQQFDQPLWDLHLLAFIEDRDFFGGLRRLRVEERPRLIFRNAFPEATDLAPGNDLRVQFTQPSFLEARTFLLVGGRYDLGPDPNELDEALFRHLVDGSIGLRRSFFDGRLTLSGGVHANAYQLWRQEDADEQDRNYQVLFLEQLVELDLRNDAVRPRLGLYASAELHEAAFLSFDYLRFIPDLRGYVPLGPLVLAARIRLGLYRIFRADAGLDPASAQLGPQPYRLRAGGPSSHRGFVAGFLGDPAIESTGSAEDPDFAINSGGQRRWEASVELRAPLGGDFDLALFGDMGDVNREARFRFRNLNLALGGGLRYRTLVGPIRFDVGWLVPGAAVVGSPGQTGAEGRRAALFPNGIFRFNGAVHISIGEAF